MSELKKTLIFGGTAVVLLLLALVTAPRQVTPDAFQDQGEAFFPDFSDPNVATSLEVIDFSEETGEAIPFKVEFKDNKWTIPSHHDYPADGKERLAKTAAGVIGVKKDDFRSDNISDHELCGVIDPLDEAATSLKGQGKRVTLKDKNGSVLADFIIGKAVEDREGMRFVRIPGQKRVYAARMNIDISTKFSDWIEADLLLVNKDDIDNIVLKDYSIDERTRLVNQRDVVVLDKDGDNWNVNKLTAGKEVNKSKVTSFLKDLDELKIVGIRPKPEGLSASLSRVSNGVSVTQADVINLQSKGYYFAQNGQLLSNEGEIQAKTKDGITYTLRFGEIVYGSGEEVTAGSEDTNVDQSKPGENRYLFITTEFDPSVFPEPKQPRNTEFLSKPDSLWTDADRENKRISDEHDRWQKKLEDARQKNDDLNTRFAKWYYVISSESFDKLHLSRKDVVKEKS